jgi:hypothetical protein
VRHPSWKSLLVVGACLAAACDRDEVTYYRVPKTPAAETGATARAAMPGDDPGRSSGAASAELRWTLPRGWTESSGNAMRFATLKPPVVGKIDGSVVVLPGPAGGELANVNRWRNQIQLPPIAEDALARAREIVRTKAGPLAVYDFTNGGAAGTRVVAGLLEIGGNTWFVKLTGDAPAVGAARSDFLKLLASLRVEHPRGPSPEAAAPVQPAALEDEVPPPARPASGGLRWTLPAGWTESPGSAMRYATLRPPVAGAIDGSVVVLPGPAGGELANVNRWRNQIQLPPIGEDALAGARKIVRTKAGPLAVYDFTNGAGTRVVAGLLESGGNTWFVKLSGEAAAVGAARGDFMKLLGSLRVDESR